MLQIDASARGIGATLEQGGQVVAYASWVLTKAERSYSVTQQECLAILYGLKQFRHYLLGGHFILQTDHAPLQWLSSQKMEGLLCRWALSLQEFDFDIQYRKGTSNANALSCYHGEAGQLNIAATLLDTGETDIRMAQQQDQHIAKIYNHLMTSPQGSHPERPGKFNPSDVTNKYGHNYCWLKDVFAEDTVQILCLMLSQYQ